MNPNCRFHCSILLSHGRSLRTCCLGFGAILTLLLFILLPVHGQAATLKVAADKPGHPISPTLYGIFFEDINCSADGGLYAELIRNRNFEDADNTEYWEALDPARTELSI